MTENVRELIRYPESFDAPEQVVHLSDSDLKQAGMAALQRNVLSPLAKATFAETWRRWSAMVTLAAAPKPGAAFGLHRTPPTTETEATNG